MASRIDKDFLGAKELPDAAYDGVQTLRGQENFHITVQRPSNKQAFWSSAWT